MNLCFSFWIANLSKTEDWEKGYFKVIVNKRYELSCGFGIDKLKVQSLQALSDSDKTKNHKGINKKEG